MAIIDIGSEQPAENYTTDLVILSDNLHLYEVDYWFPYASDSGSFYFVNFTTIAGGNLPVETITYPINLTSIVWAWLYDYYFRIHIIPNSINLGNVLTDQTQNVEVWNAFFEQQAIVSIIGTSNNLQFTNPAGTQPLGSLESRIYLLSVSGQGSPIIDDSIVINFTSTTGTLTVTGKRVVVFPFPALTDYNETQEWLTDILYAIAKEQALQLRDIPRVTYKYNYSFKTVEEFSLAKNLAKAFNHIGLATPVWSQIAKATTLPAGSLFVNISTTYMELKAGDLVINYINYKNFEVMEVIGVTSSKISFKVATTKNYVSGCYVIPLKICTLPREISFSRGPSSKNKASATFLSLDNFVLSDITGYEIFNTLPLITKNSILFNSLNEQFEHKTDIVDSQTGALNIVEIETYSRHRQNLSLVAHGQTDIFKLKRFLNYLKGRYSYFYLTTFSKDLIPTTTSLGIGADNINVNYTNIVSYPPKFIRIVGSTIVNVNVTGVSGNSITENITFASLTVAITDITHIEIITKVRADADTFELNYDYSAKNYLTAKVSIPVLEVI